MATINLDGFGHLEYEAVTTTKTFDEGDSGVVQNVTASTTVTLPATVVGTTYIVRVGKAGLTVNVSPNASDKIMGNGFTSADNKDLIFTNQAPGSYVQFVADGVNGWFVQRIRGTGTREA
jgi:hypothetical protein